MRTLIVAAPALGGFYVLSKRRAAAPPSPATRPPTEREYHDRLAHLLEAALFHGNGPMWDEVSEECRRAGRGDLPERKREEWPEQAELLDRD